MADLRRYKLSKDIDGIYLLVEKGTDITFPRSLESLLYELTQRKISYEPELIKQIFTRAQGHKERIAFLDGKQNYGALLELDISLDKMKAVLKVYPSLINSPIDFVTLERFLWKKGLKYGIKSEILSDVVKGSPYYHEWLIAEGKPSINGTDGSLKFYFETGGLDIKPKILEDGRVDYYELDIIQVVEAGKTLVERIPPTMGEKGFNVLGEEIRPRPGRDVRLPVGANTEIVANKLVSTSKGHISYANHKVNIFQTYEVNGDVDFNTGNINFPGNVIIKGNVKNGFTVRAGGDVDISGNLAGTVIIGGNLNVKKGIIQGRAEAEGNIYVRYIENGTAISKENIIVSEAIMHSTVRAGKKLSVIGGKKGLIVGGYTSVKEDITAKNIGSPMGTNTVIEVGVIPELVEEYKKICTELKRQQENHQKNNIILDSFKELQAKGKLSAEKNQLYLKVWETQYATEKEIEKLANQKNELEFKLQDVGDVYIKVLETIYSGVIINMGKFSMHLLDEKYNVVFRVEDYEIRCFNQ